MLPITRFYESHIARSRPSRVHSTTLHCVCYGDKSRDSRFPSLPLGALTEKVHDQEVTLLTKHQAIPNFESHLLLIETNTILCGRNPTVNSSCGLLQTFTTENGFNAVKVFFNFTNFKGQTTSVKFATFVTND